jgi:hypothetical protein
MYISIDSGFEYNWDYGGTASEVLTNQLGFKTVFVTTCVLGPYLSKAIYIVDATEEEVVFPALKAGIPLKILPV